MVARQIMDCKLYLVTHFTLDRRDTDHLDSVEVQPWVAHNDAVRKLPKGPKGVAAHKALRQPTRLAVQSSMSGRPVGLHSMSSNQVSIRLPTACRCPCVAQGRHYSACNVPMWDLNVDVDYPLLSSRSIPTRFCPPPLQGSCSRLSPLYDHSCLLRCRQPRRKNHAEIARLLQSRAHVEVRVYGVFAVAVAVVLGRLASAARSRYKGSWAAVAGN